MKTKVIASGSKGNCAIVLCNNTNIIIDMGISYLTLKKSLEENSLSFNDFSGIFSKQRIKTDFLQLIRGKHLSSRKGKGL